MIKVSKIPQNASEDTVRFFFENKRKSGGGDIEDLDYDTETHTAIITFEEEDGMLTFKGEDLYLFTLDKSLMSVD